MAKPMQRTQVYLPEQIIVKLEKEADKKGISKAEIIRRALEKYFKNNQK